MYHQDRLAPNYESYGAWADRKYPDLAGRTFPIEFAGSIRRQYEAEMQMKNMSLHYDLERARFQLDRERLQLERDRFQAMQESPKREN